jgi:hypothetical protein
MELPFEQDVNPFVKQAFEHQTFFTRLHHFVLASDAFVAVPGGIGVAPCQALFLDAFSSSISRLLAESSRRSPSMVNV